MGEKVIDGIEKIDLNGKDKFKIIIIGVGILGIVIVDILIRVGFIDFKILEVLGWMGGWIWMVEIGMLIMRMVCDLYVLSLFDLDCFYLIYCFIYINFDYFFLFNFFLIWFKLIMNEGC